MPRNSRIVIPGAAHHVTQRGNYKQKTFYREEDRALYLDLLRESARHYGVAIQAYCLMDNHVHFIATPHDETGLGRLFQRLSSAFARFLHIRLGRVGHLWQARYASVAMEEKHMWAAMVYVEQNPVKAGLVTDAGEWRWSSARAHLSGEDGGWLDLVSWRAQYTPETWKRVLELGLHDEAVERRVAHATAHGWPVGSADFIARHESRTGRRLQPSIPGRKRKPVDSAESASYDSGGRWEMGVSGL